MNLHSHPGIWGTKYIFSTDRHLPPGFNRATFGYFAHRCGFPGCKVVRLEGTFYDDASDLDLVQVAYNLSKEGYILHVPKERKALIRPVKETDDYREQGTDPLRADALAMLAEVEEAARQYEKKPVPVKTLAQLAFVGGMAGSVLYHAVQLLASTHR